MVAGGGILPETAVPDGATIPPMAAEPAPLLHTRVAGPGDLETLVALACRLSREAERIPAVSASFVAATTLSTRAALASPDQRIWLTESVGARPEPLATLRAELRRDPEGAPQCGFLCDVFVDERWRGRGLGAALLERAFEFLRERGATEVRLETQLGHAAAESFWESRGFHPFRTVWRRPL